MRQPFTDEEIAAHMEAYAAWRKDPDVSLEYLRVRAEGWVDSTSAGWRNRDVIYRIKVEPEVRRWSEWQNQYVSEGCGSVCWRCSREVVDKIHNRNTRIGVIRRDMEQVGDGPVRIVAVELEKV
jgi:hypothetical protein